MRDDEAEMVNPELVGEYLRSLQDGLDAAQDLVERQRIRIQRLERDRATLRERLNEARSVANRGWRDLLAAALPGTHDPDPGSAESEPGPAEPTEAGLDDTGSAIAVLPVVGKLGPVTWPRPSPTRDLRLGLVADDFTRTALRYEAHCLDLHSENGAQVLRRERPDLLFVESAYSGPDRSWQRRIARFGTAHPDLEALVGTARDLGIPTVFWNKEDPINSDWFTASMGMFDHIFTVDAGLVEHYCQRFGHDSVHALPFAAQPAIHRPPRAPSDRTGPILFAGTWFATKHPQRRAQMKLLLDPARAHGLHILDRHAGDDRRFAWPDRFRGHVVGSLPYPLAVEATRRYRVVVNVNTVTDSPTMCARRVFELAAAATPTVSSPSRAISEMMPPDAIRIVHSMDAADDAYNELLSDPAAAAAQGEAARAWVMAGHTWSHRIESILAVIAAGRR